MLSVGCSSGEEAYTLAIVGRARRCRDQDWTVSVLGLDANPAMLRRAARGRYSAWSLRETPDAVRETCFHPSDGLYEVDARIRAAVTFRQHNVTEDDPALWHAGQYDVIFCRNLLMYLTPGAAAALIRRMTRRWRPAATCSSGTPTRSAAGPDGLEPRPSHSHVLLPPAAPPRRPPPVHPPGRPPVGTAPPPAPPRARTPCTRILALMHEERFAEALRVIEDEPDRGAGPADRLTARGAAGPGRAGWTRPRPWSARCSTPTGCTPTPTTCSGSAWRAAGSVDGAIGQYRLAAYLDPAFAMPRLRLGLLARRRGDDRDAAAELDRALHLLRGERDERIVLFGGGFGRIALTALCRAELDACAVRR